MIQKEILRKYFENKWSNKNKKINSVILSYANFYNKFVHVSNKFFRNQDECLKPEVLTMYPSNKCDCHHY